MEKIKVDSVKKVPGKAGKGDLFVITSGDKEYLSFQAEIEGKVGQEVEGEIKTLKSGKESFKIAGVSSSAAGKPPGAGGGRPFGRSPEDLALTAKTMSASYAKDLCVACREADLSFKRVLEMFGEAYDVVYAKITGCGEVRKESAKETKAPEPEKKAPEKTPDKKPEPPKEENKPTDRNEITCGGANAKLKGKKVSEKFCRVCSFNSKCEVRKAEAPLSEKSDSSKKSSDPAPASSAPSEPRATSAKPQDQGKSDKVPVAFIVKAFSEQKRVGKEAFHDMIATFNVKSASEIKEPDLQEAFLGCLATLEDAE